MFEDVWENKNLCEWVKKFERSCDPSSDNRLSPLVGTQEGVKWYRVRRLVSFIIWDIYTASAISHYRRNNPDASTPLINEIGMVTGGLPAALAEKLEAAYYQCETVPWRDERPEGYSYFPYAGTDYFKSYDYATVHRIMTPRVSDLVTEALVVLAPQIEKILGHYWTAGAARVYAGKTKKVCGYHTDLWPLGLKKIMFYPSGADSELGSTEVMLADGSTKIVVGDKGVWTIFENTLLRHRAFAGVGEKDRPTIEVVLMPAFQTNPTIGEHAIHIGFPWLPPDIENLAGDRCPTSFTSREVAERTILRMLVLGTLLPDNAELPPFLKGLGLYD